MFSTVMSISTADRIKHIRRLEEALPADHLPYTDKYFIRSGQVLECEQLDPWVGAQVFIRDNGQGARLHGIDEAISILLRYGRLDQIGARIYALDDGAAFDSAETVLKIIAPARSLITLETMCLGVLSAATTRKNDGIESVDLGGVTTTMREIVETSRRDVIYMGARHWDFREDAAISEAAFEGGAVSCSTDIGAGKQGKEGSGTIPHALESAMAWKHGRKRAVVEAVKGFDRWIESGVPRVALIDFNNTELSDALLTAQELGKNLDSVRIDTCWENIAQGGLSSLEGSEADKWRRQGLFLPSAEDPDSRYWFGPGVTVTAVFALRKALDEAGFGRVGIVLSSGFAHPPRVRAFVRAEEKLGLQLFNVLGVGQVFKSRAATLDVVSVGDSPDTLQPYGKAGRAEKVNSRLVAVIP